MRPKKRTPSVRGRRSRAEAARTRERILDRAEVLFARKGYRAVSTRELARACGVHPYTIQHHFGSKLKLYEATVCRWDDEIRALSLRRFAGDDVKATVGGMVDALLDFLLAKSDWVALNIRRGLGEGLPGRIQTADLGWVQFIDSSLHRIVDARRDLDSRLLLLTVEGILHHHVASQGRYRELLGRDLNDPELRRRVKQHLASVVEAILRLPTAGSSRRRASARPITPKGTPRATRDERRRANRPREEAAP